SEAIQVAERELGSTSFLRYAREIAETHHEKWDGSGYPKGLKGEEIPLSGRLMAVSDVYDALISKRVYKSSFSHEKARRIIVEGHGTHFDPVLVDAFITIENQFMEIASQHKDGH
ncbi:MAG: HD domain-containing phosphohydrolase, partial [Candidatus Sedimenticola sp. (ex Thyasira tokunagai)]